MCLLQAARKRIADCLNVDDSTYVCMYVCAHIVYVCVQKCISLNY